MSRYRCPFCQSQRRPIDKRARSPLGTLAQILVGTLGLIGLIAGLFAWIAVEGKERIAHGEEPSGIGLVSMVVVLGVSAWLGLTVWIEVMLRQRQQVCPDCKVRLN